MNVCGCKESTGGGGRGGFRKESRTRELTSGANMEPPWMIGRVEKRRYSERFVEFWEFFSKFSPR